jgi:hypothetical protein
LIQIGPVASEELIKMWKVNGRTDDGRSVVTIAHLTLPFGSGELIKEKHSVLTSRENINTKANYQLWRSRQWSSTAIFSISIQPD